MARSRASRRTGSRQRPRLDLLSLLLAPAGISVIVLAQLLDGVAISSLLHGTAALIVFGGTLGAVLVTYRPGEVGRAVGAALGVYRQADNDTDALAASLVALSIRAHRRGVLALEADVEQVADPFLRDGLRLVVDNMPGEAIAEFLAVEKSVRDADDEAPARVFEAAAGYAPTLGILGAVLGLIQIMGHLGTPATLGAGIAMAFVATAYGVGVANLVLLPLAGRLRERAAVAARRRDLISQGVRAIQERANPRVVARRLRSFSSEMPHIEEIATRLAGRPAPGVRGVQ